jgi:hypothetical protein
MQTKRIIHVSDDIIDTDNAIFILFVFLDSTARKNIQNKLYKKQDYLFYTIIV